MTGRSMCGGTSIHFDNEFNGFQFTIEPSENATQRTKNRIKERGPTFYLVSVCDRTFMHDEKVVLFRSTDDLWMGWLPEREIKIVRVFNG